MDRDLELKIECKGNVVLEITSHITPSCIALSSEKLRANIQADGRKSDEKDRISTRFTSNLKNTAKIYLHLKARVCHVLLVKDDRLICGPAVYEPGWKS